APARDHRRAARTALGRGRRLALPRRAEPAAGLPRRGAGLRAHHPAVSGRAGGARAARDPRAVGDGRVRADRLARAPRPRPALAPARGAHGVRGSLRRTARLMDFAYSEKVEDLRRRLEAFMEEHVYPNEPRFDAW